MKLCKNLESWLFPVQLWKSFCILNWLLNQDDSEHTNACNQLTRTHPHTHTLMQKHPHKCTHTSPHTQAQGHPHTHTYPHTHPLTATTTPTHTHRHLFLTFSSLSRKGNFLTNKIEKWSDFENEIPGNKKCGRDYKLQNVSIKILNGDGAVGNDLSFILSNLTSLNQKIDPPDLQTMLSGSIYPV